MVFRSSFWLIIFFLVPLGNHLAGQDITGSPHFLKAKGEAAEKEIPMLVHFTASWSKPCSKMFGTTYRNQEILEFLSNDFVFTIVDIDDFDGYVLSKHYNIENLPTLVLFDQEGRVLRFHRGYADADQFTDFLFNESETDKSGDQEIAESSSPTSSPQILERINDVPEKSRLDSNSKENMLSSSTSGNEDSKDILTEFYSIQLGAFSTKDNAESMRSEMEKSIDRKLMLFNEEPRYLILGGQFQSREEAEDFLSHLKKKGHNGFIKKIGENT